MGFIIDRKKVSIEIRKESFYIQDLESNLEGLEIIELDYEAIPELESLLNELKENERYKLWLSLSKTK